MKKSILFILMLVAIVGQTSAQNIRSLTKEQAWEIVKEKILANNLDGVNVSVLNTVVKANAEIEVLLKNENAPDFDSWFFFIDDRPFESWEHPCRYVFVNVKDGAYLIVNKRRPPLSHDMDKLVEQKKVFVEESLFSLNEARTITPVSQSSVNDYAVIISGGMNADMNWQRYWNDCSAIYMALVYVYKYPKDHIYVLMSDGNDPGADMHLNSGSYMSSNQDLDGDGTNDIKYSATKANITTVFNELSSKLTAKDNLFIFTTDHGGQVSGRNVYFCLWNDIMLDYEFAEEVNKVNAGKINICMGQCNSGGFIDDLQGENKVIATACAYNQSSYSMTNLMYDEFVYHWVAAVKGSSPGKGTTVNADTNNNGQVSMNEAFSYAQKHDTRAETPQYSSIPAVLGDNLLLAQKVESKGMSIAGKNVTCSDDDIYYVSNLKDGMTVIWDYANQYGGFSIIEDNPSPNQCTFINGSGNFDLDLIANVYDNGSYYATITKHVYGKRPTLSGSYSQEACNYYGVNHPEIKSTSINEGSAIFFHMGCLGQIKSEHFKGMNVTHNGTEPEYFNFNGINTIELKFPLNSGGRPMHIVGTCDNSAANFDLLVFAVTGNGNVPNSLNVKPSSNGYEISFADNCSSNGFATARSASNEEWDVNVYDLMSTTKIFSAHVSDNRYEIDTTNWHKGTYVLQIKKGGEIYAKKIYVK